MVCRVFRSYARTCALNDHISLYIRNIILIYKHCKSQNLKNQLNYLQDHVEESLDF